MIQRMLIANRGEVALRIIKSCRENNIETVAVYSEADKLSPHLSQADKTICIGPGPSNLSYLNREAYLQAAINTECQAIHPGYGFLAEDFLFAYMCSQQKLIFIGPSPDLIRLMGNKSKAKQTVEKAGLATIPGSKGNLADLSQALKLADRVNYPVLLKASAGGGGKGIRPCYCPEDIKKFYPQARMEAEKSFGNPDLYLEKLIQNGRHIEFQILADTCGNVVHLGERECSIQRKNQKLIEESPSPGIDINLRNQVGKRITSSLRDLGYINAGTMEFLMDEDKNLYFMEMNTRLQVEHPVTEMITGIDIVNEQIKIALNQFLSFRQKEIKFKGHAVECRINAEDPDNNFNPSPGIIEAFNPELAGGPGELRLDTHVEKGYEIPPYYDSMICKMIAWGEDRASALKTMANGLKKFTIKGIKTTIPLHRHIIESKEFREGNYNTGSLTAIMGSED